MDISQLLLQQPKDAMVEDNTLPFLAQEQRKDPDLKNLIRITLPSDPAETYKIIDSQSPLRGGEVGVFPWGLD